MDVEVGVDKRGRMLALFGLAAKRRATVGNCLTDTQISALLDDRLGGKARNGALAHLNTCPHCYHLWLEAASYLADSATQPAATSKISPRLMSIWDYIVARPSRWGIAFSTAAATIVVFVSMVFLRPSLPELEQQLDTSYARIVEMDRASVEAVLNEVPLPWDNSVLAMSESDVSRPARAFGAGLWAGRIDSAAVGPGALPLPTFLTPDGPASSDGNWSDYYALGRWMTLLWVLTEPAEYPPDWERQQSILQQLLENLRSRPVGEQAPTSIITSLEGLQALLTDLSSRNAPTVRDQLRSEVEMLMQRIWTDS